MQGGIFPRWPHCRGEPLNVARKPKKPKQVAATVHDEASRKNIPTAELQTHAQQMEETDPYRPVAYPRRRNATAMFMVGLFAKPHLAAQCMSASDVALPPNGPIYGALKILHSSISLASGSLAMVIWYLIERAFFSLISAVSRSPTIFCGSCRRFTAVAMISSYAAFIP